MLDSLVAIDTVRRAVNDAAASFGDPRAEVLGRASIERDGSNLCGFGGGGGIVEKGFEEEGIRDV